MTRDFGANCPIALVGFRGHCSLKLINGPGNIEIRSITLSPLEIRTHNAFLYNWNAVGLRCYCACIRRYFAVCSILFVTVCIPLYLLELSTTNIVVQTTLSTLRRPNRRSPILDSSTTYRERFPEHLPYRSLRYSPTELAFL